MQTYVELTGHVVTMLEYAVRKVAARGKGTYWHAVNDAVELVQ